MSVSLQTRSLIRAIYAFAVGVALVLPTSCRSELSDSDRDMNLDTGDILEFYSTQSPFTDPGRFARYYEDVPARIEDIVRVVQGNLIRLDEVERSPQFSPGRIRREVGLDTVEKMLERLLDMDGSPLTNERSPRRRVVGICNHFAMLTCSLLRYHGIPARTRSGFETYWSDAAHHDHTVCEYWNSDESRWILVDAEITIDGPRPDRIDFDPLDLPGDAFLSGSDAWKLSRTGEVNPEHFGIMGDKWIGGWDFVLSGLVHDFWMLNKSELQPSADNRLTKRGYSRLDEDDLALLDEAARLALGGDSLNVELRRLHATNRVLRR